MTVPISQPRIPPVGVQRDRERLAGVLERRDVRQERAGVEVDGVATERLDERDTGASSASPRYAVERIR